MANNIIYFQQKNNNTSIENSDGWCAPIEADNGSIVSGGAARNVRISRRGGMGNIIADACAHALAQANHKDVC
ncbi:TPA: hypothetical protein N3C02_002502 [Vibrio parahaemolyticus]|uniref:hypothetical protein n=1 Tax=Vibrio TaxID=662 RepID=UPI000BD771DE|nr:MULTISPECIES: hypothetical protein [Vibrio]HAS6725320.1 hypothetical protein [Vibrio parahaemolyticus]OZT85553.1 hypothetical protein CIK04_06215 [Vibrio sp. 03_296]PJO13120.1 hypothetical protein COO31_010580 [Vibrio vulnificus]HAS6783575.1 hypothetical protein [Vibrio parahaemolyticus]HAS6791007.1 hypothetical protein [Vibrio parahaemolyticus]